MRNLELFIEGERLELFDAQSINITEVVQDVRDIANVFSDYTQQFKVPASDVNNKIFKHYYNYEIDNGFDARFRRDSIIKVSGADYKFGKLRLDGVEMRNGKAFAYKLVFFGSGSKLTDLIGNFKLSDLDYLNKFNHTYTEDSVRSGVQVGLGLVDGEMVESTRKDIVYPLISNAPYFFYDSSGSTDSSGNEESPSKNLFRGLNNGNQFPDNGFDYTDLKPSIRLIRIIEAIEDKFNGLRFSRDFFGKSPFNELYMHLHRDKGIMRSPLENKSRFYSYDDFNTNKRLIVRNDGISDGDVKNTLTLTYSIKAGLGSESSEYKVFIKDSLTGKKLADKTISGGDADVEFKLESVAGETREYIPILTIESSDEEFNSFEIELSIVEYEITYEQGQGNDLETYDSFYRFPSSGSYSLGGIQTFTQDLVITEQIPEMTCIDFLTTMFKMFNLTAFFDQASSKVVVQTLKSYYLDGDTVDITEFISSEESTISKASLFSDIKFEYEDPKTIGIINQNTILDDNFGDLEFETSNLTDPDTGNKVYFDGKKYEIKAKFEHLLYERLSDEDDLSVQTQIQTGWLVDEEESPIKTNPIIHFVVPEDKFEVSAIGFSGQGKPNLTSYFRASNVSQSGNNTLNFGSEKDEFNLNQAENENGLFKRFYDYYISDLFNKKTRIIEVDALVPNSFIINHKLNDFYVINNRGYRADTIKINLNNGRAKFKLINTDFLPDNLPSSPLNLSLEEKNVGERLVSVSWNTATSLSRVSYNLYLDGVLLKVVPETYDVNGNPIFNETFINDLELDKSYSLEVSAVNDDGEGQRSAPLVFILSEIDTTAPSIPQNLTLAAQQLTSLAIDWDVSTDDTGVAGYNVYVDGFYYSTENDNDTVLTGLDSGVDYEVKVNAFDAYGNVSDFSQTLTVSLQDEEQVALPTAPTDLRNTNKWSDFLSFEWGYSYSEAGISGYNVYLDGSFYKTVETESITINGLDSSTNYEVSVEAVDDNGLVSRRTNPLREKTSPTKNGRFRFSTSEKDSAFKLNSITGTSSGSFWTSVVNGTTFKTKVGANPTFDLSGAVGEVIFTVSNANLTDIDMSGFDITSVSFDGQPDLESVDLSFTKLQNIDLSKNPLLTSVDLSNGTLEDINVANGNNIDLIQLDVRNNPNSNCIQVDSVDDVKVGWLKDSGQLFNETCPFESFSFTTDFSNVIDLDVATEGASNYSWTISNLPNGSGKDLDLTGNTGGADVDVSFLGVATDIELSNKSLTDLDVRNNTGLNALKCFSNNLTSLEVSKNTELTELRCQTNTITTLDVSNNTLLTVLICNKNNLTSLNVSSNTVLRSLTCSENNLTTLDVSNNTLLEALGCTDTNISSLNISNNTELDFLQCSKNNLTTLDVSNNTKLSSLFCDSNNLTPASIDNIFIDLDSHGLSNGSLKVGLGRTVASDTAYVSLTAKGWTITEI